MFVRFRHDEVVPLVRRLIKYSASSTKQIVRSRRPGLQSAFFNLQFHFAILLSLPRAIEIGGRAEEDLGGEAHRFAERGMGMDRLGSRHGPSSPSRWPARPRRSTRRRPRRRCRSPARDRWPGSMSHFVRPSVRPTGLGPAAGGPGELGHFHRAALRLGLGFGQAGPGDFRIGEDHGGNRRAARRRRCGRRWPRPPTCPRGAALWASIGWPATSPMAQIRGSAVRRCGSTATKPCLSIWTLVFSRPRPSLLGRRPTETSTRLNCWTLSIDACRSKVTSIAWPLSTMETTFMLSRISAKSLLSFLCNGRTRSRSAPGKQAVGQLDDADPRAQGGVDRAHLQADVAAADHQQRLGHVGQFQRGGRVHHPRRGQVEGRYPSRAASRWRGCSSRSGSGRRPAARCRPAAAAASAVLERALGLHDASRCACRRSASARR